MAKIDNDWYIDEMYFGSAAWPSHLVFRINIKTDQIQVKEDRDGALWYDTYKDEYISWAVGAWRGVGEWDHYFNQIPRVERVAIGWKKRRTIWERLTGKNR